MTTETDFGWSFEPWVVIPLTLTALLYYSGSRRLARRSQVDRKIPTVLFWVGLAALALALLSPLHEYGEHIFTAHMVEHEILMVVAAPLLVVSQPGAILLWGMPNSLKIFTVNIIRHRYMRSFWHGATDLGSATILHTGVLWLWHLPYLFQGALRHEWMHILQHLSFIISALIFWSAIWDRDRRHYEQGLAALALFFTSLQAALLGAILTFSTRIWYPEGPDPLPICGLTRLEDQSLAGLIMWVPACSLYVVAALVILARWLKFLELKNARAG